jgi:site-specific recombinase XerD
LRAPGCGDSDERKSQPVNPTFALEKALREYRHLRGPRVLQRDEDGPLTEKLVQNLVGGAARKANLRNNGPHILGRHTFCSHLTTS